MKRLLILAAQTIAYHGGSIICLPPDAMPALPAHDHRYNREDFPDAA